VIPEADATTSGRPALGIREDGLPGPIDVTVHSHDFAGTVGVEIPVPLPQARGVPALSIAYSQGAANGHFGLGMALSVPSVGRRIDLGVPAYDANDAFLGPGGEQLVPGLREAGAGMWAADGRAAAADGVPYSVRTYRTRTATHDQRIERWSAADGSCFWQVRDARNTVAVYGRSESARVADPSDPRRVARWLLEEEADPHGNVTRYAYRPENGAGWSGWAPAGGHAEKYLASITYCNYRPAAGADQQFAFEVVLDYGEWDLSGAAPAPVREWAVRADPVVNCRYGFPIQTLRLCRSVLVVNHIPEPAGTARRVTAALELGYDENPVHSRLTSATVAGFRDGERAALPAATFSYAGFDPSGAGWRELKLEDGGTPPGVLGGRAPAFADLRGEGIPGLLVDDGEEARYFPPRGGGVLGPPEAVPNMPAIRDREAARFGWEDIEGDGHLSLVMVGESGGGSFRNGNDGGWGPFRPFDAFPTEAVSRAARWVDVDGDGRTDLMVATAGEVRCYPSEGARGFAEARAAPAPADFPRLDSADQRELVTFADVLGDGLAHCVRVRDGRVDIWPSLGYGRFGAMLSLAGAPRFGPTLTADRILVAGFAGSGRADLMLVHGDHAELYVNEGGTALSAPLRLPIPGGVGAADRVGAADIDGVGHPCLYVARAGSAAQTLYLDPRAGAFPFAMEAVANGIGGSTRFGYRSSTDFYLEDRAGGRPWATRLATPVLAVALVEHVDEVTGVHAVDRRHYRDGYFDASERTFRGFGSIEVRDAAAAGPDLPPGGEGRLTRHWFDVGAVEGREALLSAHRAEQFEGDPSVVRAAPSAAGAAAVAAGMATLRDAGAALAGVELHSEVYAVAADGTPATVPLATVDNGYVVELVQPARSGARAALDVRSRESVRSAYEGVAGDPRVEHDATLRWDAYGHPTRSASLAYPRRVSEVPGQSVLRAVLHEEDYATLDLDDAYLTGVSWQTRLSELAGVAPSGGQAGFGYAELDAAVDAAAAPGARIAYGSDFTGGPQARLLEWTRAQYWDGPLSGPCPYGTTGAQALLHHREEAVYPEGFAERVSESRISAPMLAQDGGYRQADGHWWRDEAVVSYYGADGFYTPRSLQEPFETPTACTMLAYDEPYWLFPVLERRASGLTHTQEPDYAAMAPRTLVDENGIATEALYDPLGRVIAVGEHAQTTAGGYRGDMTLANYVRGARPTLEEVIADAGRFLQGAGAFRLEVLDGWAGAGLGPGAPTAEPGSPPTPACHVTVHARRWADAATASAPAATPLVTVTYLNGFGQELESRVRVEAALAGDVSGTPWTWISRGRVDRENRGRVLRSYLPAFVPGFDVLGAAGPSVEHTYDALDRELRQDLPSGFLTRVERPDAWTISHFDENDSVCESRYYREHADDQTLPPEQRRALQMAATFRGTPTVDRLGPRGVLVERDETDLDASGGSSQVRTSAAAVDARGLQTSVTDGRLPAGSSNLAAVYDMLGRPLRLARADSGVVDVLLDAADLVAHRWRPRGEHLRTVFDPVTRRPVQERLVATGGAEQVVATFAYGTDPAALSAGRLVQVEDQTGRHSVDRYDLLGQPERSTSHFAQQVAGTLDWSAPASVSLLKETWTAGTDWDRSGRPVAAHCPDGSTITYGRYANGWVSGAQLIDPAGTTHPVVSAIGYTASGERTGAVCANGVELSREYEPLTLEVSAIGARATATGAVLRDLTYTYDPAGNVCAVADAAPPGSAPKGQAVTKRYTYDSRYRLQQGTGRAERAAPETGDYTETDGYDAAGNLIHYERSFAAGKLSGDYTVSATSNRALPPSMAPDPGSVEAGFDAAGNPRALDDGTKLAHDWEGQLTGVSRGGLAAAYRYDRSGLRRRRQVVSATGVSDRFHVGSAYVHSEPGSAGPAFSLVFEELGDDTVVAERDAAGKLSLRYLLADRTGSVIAELDEHGARVRAVDYYPYGQPSVTVGPDPAPGLELGFAGKEHDPETGLVYFGGRHYNPAWGRWLTPDPLGEVDGLDLYAYVGGNPTTDRDPEGFARPKRGARVVKKAAATAAAAARKRTQAPAKWVKGKVPGQRRRVFKAAVPAPGSVTAFGLQGAKLLDVGFGGDISEYLDLATGTRFQVARWVPKASNTGVGISRRYGLGVAFFRVAMKTKYFVQRRARSMFKWVAGRGQFVRGHLIPHADTEIGYGGKLSSSAEENLYAELEGWGEQQRKRREAKARKYGVPVVHVNVFEPGHGYTDKGLRIPTRVFYVELTGLAGQSAGLSTAEQQIGAQYAAEKDKAGYNMKAYGIETATYDYDAQPAKSGDRRVLKPSRVTTLPPAVASLVARGLPPNYLNNIRLH
jgi:RHS repeat-associated protein